MKKTYRLQLQYVDVASGRTITTNDAALEAPALQKEVEQYLANVEAATWLVGSIVIAAAQGIPGKYFCMAGAHPFLFALAVIAGWEIGKWAIAWIEEKYY